MIKSRSEMKTMQIDLQGEQGNSFYLLHLAQSLAKSLKMDDKQIVAEMQEDDYEHLIQTFDKYFGDFITLYR
jgi:hypothetical protein